jgi:hypothetical protein
MSEMSETEMFTRLIDSLNQAEYMAIGLSQVRQDIRWKAVANTFSQARDNVIILAKGKDLPLVSKEQMINTYFEKQANLSAVNRYQERMKKAHEENRKIFINESKLGEKFQ